MKLRELVYVSYEILINQLLIQMLIDQLSCVTPAHDCKQIVKISRIFH